MTQQNMGFHATIGVPELSPREQGKVQRDGGGIQRQQLILEANFVAFAAQRLLVAEPGEGGPEQVAKQGGRDGARSRRRASSGAVLCGCPDESDGLGNRLDPCISPAKNRLGRVGRTAWKQAGSSR